MYKLKILHEYSNNLVATIHPSHEYLLPSLAVYACRSKKMFVNSLICRNTCTCTNAFVEGGSDRFISHSIEY